METAGLGLNTLEDNEASNYSELAAENFMRIQNSNYRSGNPTMPDERYDSLMGLYAAKFPDNAFFNQKEVESDLDVIEGKTVNLPERMLSTNKAYSLAEIEKWAKDVVKVGAELGVVSPLFKITPKLDGFAAYDDGKALYTRGNGRSGTDITRALDRGLMVAGRERGQGAGEIVVSKTYFEQKLSGKYENSRNIIAGILKEGELDNDIGLTIMAGAVCFQPFSKLNHALSLGPTDLVAGLESMWVDLLEKCPFNTDGLVIEATDERIKEAMGHTNHHHRWQIAYKKNTEYHNIKVIGITSQTSKNGRITPVVELEPTKVSGVTISRATGHHYGNIIAKGIDAGAIVRVCRSGQVIPYIESVIEKADAVHIPALCPSCNNPAEMDGDNLLCTNTETCPAQIEGIIEFFFKTLGNCDGFGPKVIESLCSGRKGAKTVFDIYNFDEESRPAEREDHAQEDLDLRAPVDPCRLGDILR